MRTATAAPVASAPPALPFPPIRLGTRSDTGEPVELTDGELVRHTAVFGATGTGKTALFLAVMLQLMDRGRGFIFCTTKHDPMLPRALAYAARLRTQLWRLRIFDPMHPVHAYNPTSTRNPVTLARLYHSQLPRIDPGSEAQHYHDLAMEFLLVACRAVLATGLRHVPDDILQIATNWDVARGHLRERLKRIGAQDLLADLDAFFRRFTRRRPDGKEDFHLHEAREALSGLTAALTNLGVGPFMRFLSEPGSAVDLLHAHRRGLWVYLGLPRALSAGEGQLGRLFLIDLIATLDEIQSAEGTLVHVPFVIILDEFPSYAIPEFAAVFEQARSAGGGLIMAAQTVSGLTDRTSGLSEGFRDRILGNCANILSFRIGPGESAEYLSRYVGKSDRPFEQASQTEAHGRTYSPIEVSNWLGLTHRTDQRMTFSGYRIAKDLVVESRVLTHELAPRGEVIWLSRTGASGQVFRFRSVWADMGETPQKWDYQMACSKFVFQPPPPLDLGSIVRQENLRRSIAQGPPPPHARESSHPAPPPPPEAAERAGARPGRTGSQPGSRRRRRPVPTTFLYAPPGTPEGRIRAPAPPPSGAPEPERSSPEPDCSAEEAGQAFMRQDSDDTAGHVHE